MRGDGRSLLVGRGGSREVGDRIEQGDVVYNRQGEVVGFMVSCPQPQEAKAMAHNWEKISSSENLTRDALKVISPWAQGKKSEVTEEQVRKLVTELGYSSTMAGPDVEMMLCLRLKNTMEAVLEQIQELKN